MPVLYTSVTADVIDSARLAALVDDPQAGAVVTFEGVIRNHDPEAIDAVVSVDYSCHPQADQIMADCVQAALTALAPAGMVRVAVAHRVGQLNVGDVALVCCVASAHRAEAFGACASVVEAIKADVPIWKHQVEVNGRAVWSGLGLETEAEQ